MLSNNVRIVPRYTLHISRNRGTNKWTVQKPNRIWHNACMPDSAVNQCSSLPFPEWQVACDEVVCLLHQNLVFIQRFILIVHYNHLQIYLWLYTWKKPCTFSTKLRWKSNINAVVCHVKSLWSINKCSRLLSSKVLVYMGHRHLGPHKQHSSVCTWLKAKVCIPL